MNREELIDLRKQVQKVIEDGRAFPADVLSAQIVLVFEQAHTPTEAYEKPLDTSPEPVKNGGDSLHVTPTDDERAPGFAEREKRAARAWEFFARDDREMSHDFRAGYHQGMIDGFRRTVQGEPSDSGKTADSSGI